MPGATGDEDVVLVALVVLVVVEVVEVVEVVVDDVEVSLEPPDDPLPVLDPDAPLSALGAVPPVEPADDPY